MNKKGFTEKNFINLVAIVAFLILIYLVYKAIMSQFGKV